MQLRFSPRRDSKWLGPQYVRNHSSLHGSIRVARDQAIFNQLADGPTKSYSKASSMSYCSSNASEFPNARAHFVKPRQGSVLKLMTRRHRFLEKLLLDGYDGRFYASHSAIGANRLVTDSPADSPITTRSSHSTQACASKPRMASFATPSRRRQRCPDPIKNL